MPNDPASQILEMMGIDSYSGEPKQEAVEQQPTRPEANKPQLFESDLFQQAVEIFTQEYGHPPATDSDFEGPGGVLEFMNMLQGDNSAAGAQGNVMKQMGEEADAEGNEELRRGR